MKRSPMILISMILSFALVAALAAEGLAQPAATDDRDTEEEGYSAYSVARLKVFEGTAWVRLPDSGEWEEYTTNTPVPERARVNVPEGSEAELQFHGGQFVLLTGGTELDVRKFDENGTAFRIRSGEIRFDLPADDFSPVSVGLPEGGKTAFNVPGRYWLSVKDGGEARLVVRRGEGDVSVAQGSRKVKAGEEAAIGRDVRVSAYSGGSGEREEAAPPPVTQEEEQAGVPPAAAYELRDYGEWVSTNDYGYVWRPRVVAGWSPYYYGQWVWISPYGWTWVSNEPWGWYPYHYGWWFNDPFFGWCWSPFRSFVSFNFTFGSYRYAHFHRNAFFYPATVRFVRDGGFVRWVPLRPGERFVRPGFTRTNARLAAWERPIPRGTVFARSTRDGKKSEWRNWSDTARRDGRHVVVRETDSRRSGDIRREVPQVRDDGRVRTRTGGERRDGQDRQERMQQRRELDRQERPQRREFRGREGRSDGGSPSPTRDRPAAVRSYRESGPRVQGDAGSRRERYGPPARAERPAARGDRGARPGVVSPPPYRGDVRRGEPSRMGNGSSGRVEAPRHNMAPDRGPARVSPERGPGNVERPGPERGDAGRDFQDRGGGRRR